MKEEIKVLKQKNNEWDVLAKRVMKYKHDGSNFEKAFDEISEKLSENPDDNDENNFSKSPSQSVQ